MGFRSIIFGDVHGCIDELDMLLRELEWQSHERLISVGDLVAKGPDSKAVISFCMEHQVEAVLGNHEAHLHKAILGQSAAPYHVKLAQGLSKEEKNWILGLPLYLKIPSEDLLVVHAGIDQRVPLSEQSKEHLITMRSVDLYGNPSKDIHAGTAWAKRYKGPEHVVFGHDAVRGLQQEPFATGLDTGCVYGNRLTALVLPERRLVSVKAKRAYVRPGG